VKPRLPADLHDLVARFRVAVAGRVSLGKSTFVNAVAKSGGWLWVKSRAREVARRTGASVRQGALRFKRR
jgi:hypothetical protein